MNAQNSNISVQLNDLDALLAENPEYQDIMKRLRILFKTEKKIDAWLGSPNARMNQPPLCYIKEGNFDVVSSVIAAIEYGIPS
jgi:Protein of unknown function (DUF2384)